MTSLRAAALAVALCLVGAQALAVPAAQLAPSIAGPTVAIGQGGTNATTYLGAQTALGLAPGAALFSDGIHLSIPFIQETLTTPRTLTTADLGYHVDLCSGFNQTQALPLSPYTIEWGYGAGLTFHNKCSGVWTITAASGNTVNGLPALVIYPNQDASLGSDGVSNYTADGCTACLTDLGPIVFHGVESSITGLSPAILTCAGCAVTGSNQRFVVTGISGLTTASVTFNISDPWPSGYVPVCTPTLSTGVAIPFISTAANLTYAFGFSASFSGTLYVACQ